MESHLSDIICSGFGKEITFAGQIYDGAVCWQFLNLKRLNLRNVHKAYRFSYKCRGKASNWGVFLFINFIPINLLKCWNVGIFVSGRVTAFKREKR